VVNYSLNKRLVYADDVNILGRSVHIIKNNTEALVAVSKRLD
jgi:hypothetical protein